RCSPPVSSPSTSPCSPARTSPASRTKPPVDPLEPAGLRRHRDLAHPHFHGADVGARGERRIQLPPLTDDAPAPRRCLQASRPVPGLARDLDLIHIARDVVADTHLPEPAAQS